MNTELIHGWQNYTLEVTCFRADRQLMQTTGFHQFFFKKSLNTQQLLHITL